MAFRYGREFKNFPIFRSVLAKQPHQPGDVRQVHASAAWLVIADLAHFPA
jgi:hypothetical protein